MKKVLDKNNRIKLLFIFIYIVIILVLYLKGVIHTDIQTIKLQLERVDHLMFWYFIASVFRFFLFIPSTVFIIVGGILFDPWTAFILSVLAFATSQSIIYFFTKLFFDTERIQQFISKHEKVVKLLQKYQLKLLATGVSSPIVPSDALSSASAIIGIRYLPFLTTIVLAGAPLTFLYSFIGEQILNDSYFNIGLIVIFVLIFIYFSYRIYHSITNEK